MFKGGLYQFAFMLVNYSFDTVYIRLFLLSNCLIVIVLLCHLNVNIIIFVMIFTLNMQFYLLNFNTIILCTQILMNSLQQKKSVL